MELYGVGTSAYYASSVAQFKVLVPVKRVIDYAVKIRVAKDESGVETKGVKHSMNPFDEIAVEAALKLKDQGLADEVVIVSAGDKETVPVLRTGLAMGGDRAIHVKSDEELQPITVANILQKVVAEEKPDLVILGKQAIDGDNSTVGPYLAGLLDWPQVTFASKIELNADKTAATVEREVDGGLETLSMPLPGVITADLRLNEPRYATLPNIMKAKKKPLDTKLLADLGVENTHTYETLKVQEPPAREAGVIVEDVDALIAALKKEGFVK